MLTELLLMLAIATGPADCALDEQDEAANRVVDAEFREAWIANDVARVGALLSDSATIIPHHGAQPRIGKGEAMQFWFPDGEVVAPLSRFETTLHDIDGCGDIALARGCIETLEWEYQGQRWRNGNGNYLTVYRRQSDGRWLISHHIWNDPPNQRIDD